ncbi:MAG TPA: 7TM diverse intracellular signaling domain-containing protein [Oligoflexus sp.]|uniref:7TM diverse intracellular signaling domain-containing protein n=1 Tax=Oligoflexus sp. TaxID=1971216 RepID=UPI002D5CB613|nr:7TM diverse intracellular signaling domain-containing protein [Oligoflexus sp.]HYX38754.1 7TM diverse intracellular signaling domain-containing protein [Oligoflexus sp.]
MLLAFLGGCIAPHHARNFQMQNGRLDLKNWDDKNGSQRVEMRGDWRFIPGDFVPGSDVERWTQAQTLNLPGTWANAYQGEGIVSLRADVEIRESDQWGLFLNDAPSAIEVWVNGQRLGASGQVGRDSSTTIPSRKSLHVRLPKADRYEIIIYMSNFLHARGGVYYPVTLAKYEAFDYSQRLRQIMEAGFAASILMIGLYHGFLYFIRRETVTIVFAICCGAVAQRLASSNTRIFDLFLDPSWEISYRLEYGSLYVIAPLLETFIGLLFPKDYPKKLIPWRVGWYAAILCSLLFPISVVTNFLRIAHVGHLSAVLVTAYTLTLAMMRQRVGIRWISLGMICMIVFSSIDVINSYQDQTGTYTLHMGFLIFILFQAGAIAKNYASIQSSLMEEEAKRKHSYRQLGKVFYPHQLLMMEGGRNLEDTMPTGPGKGCVLCFDIIGSSTIKHINKTQVIKKFFTHCYEVMMENYSTSNLSANAYRMKEMGDGFLCSIGYPFKVPDGSNEAAFATRMALRFIAIFDEHIKTMDYPLPIHCAVGIAGGDLEGFYPESGTREYDLYGRAVILATRYEGMRKHLFQGQPDASVLVIQEEIYLSLPTDLRKRFMEFDLTRHNLKVRDDPSARVLYYAMVSKEQDILYPHTGT